MSAHPYDGLVPDVVIDAVESTGRQCDLRIFPLNSYENRVYQVGVEDATPVIAKFYRPARWSDAEIIEEHRFSHELADAELPVVAPLRNEDGESLFEYGGFRFALYPRVGGYTPDLEDPDQLLSMGRILGRMHAIGAAHPFSARPALTIREFGSASSELIAAHFIPADLREAYCSLRESILPLIERQFQPDVDDCIRTHGDLHKGNILWRDADLCLVDLDDCRTAPAIQDVWMLLSGERHERLAQLSELAEGYNEFFDFPANQLKWIESLRTLRILHHAAWLARRWDDPAFPRHFPWFASPRFWSDHILELREQFAALQEEPLSLF